MKPPTVNNKVDTVIVANTATAAIPTNVGPVTDRQITIVCTSNFDIIFSDDGTNNVPNPLSTVVPFQARTLYTFELGPKNTHYKAISAASTIRHWVSSRT